MYIKQFKFLIATYPTKRKEQCKLTPDEFTARTEKIKNRLYRTAFLYLGNENLAIDAVDEAVFHGFKAMQKLRQAEFFETWLTRILINECKKELRRRKRVLIFEEVPETISEAEENAFDALPLKDAILRLPQPLKDVVILRYFSGFTLAQTAESLKIPQGTVVTRQRKALKLLKLELSEEVQ